MGRALAAGLVLFVLVAGRSASADTSDCHQSVSTETCTFSYTGSEQTFVVPAGVTEVSISAVGAEGGGGENSSGGAGGKATVGNVSVTAGETLYVEVGGVGGINSAGWNGGGLGNAGGGGASDVRTVSCGSDCASGGGGTSLASRLVVGGGGGGGAEPGNTPGGIPAGGTGGDAGNDGTAGGDTGGYGDSGGGGGAGTLAAGGAGGAAGTNALGETTMDPGHDGQAGASGAGGAGGADALGFPGGDPGGGGGGGYFGGGGGGSAANGAELQSCTIQQLPPLPPLQTLCNVPVVSAGGGGGGGSSYAPGGTVVAADGSASVTISYTLPPAAPTITSDGQTTFTAGTAGSFTVTASGSPAPALEETGDLPAGATFLDNGDGTATLSGTPAADTVGTYPLTIGASNGNLPDATQDFTLTVDESPAITSADATTFPVGADGTFTVTTTGAPTPALSETGALPAGVSFVDNGDGTATLSGTPAVDSNGTYPLTIGASNGIAPDASQDFTLTVDEAPAVTSANHTSFGVGEAGSFTVTTAGDPTPSLSETGALPAGVTFVDNHDGTATLSGTPTAAGSFPLTIGAANGVPTDASQSFTLTVVAAASLPHVTSFTPLAAPAGTHVTFAGTVLNGVTEVDFANSAAPATIVSQTATKLVVSVPGDAAAGPLTITTAVGHFTTSQTFKPLPKVTSLDAYDGAAGNLVKIFGTNLDDASAVKFGTFSATPIAVSATEVDAHVPLTGFSSGKVSVTTPGGTAVSTQTFAITKITGFSPLAAKAGATVTLIGQGLASTQSVDFVNSSSHATIVGTPTATSVKVLVPDDAAVGDIFVNTANTTPGSVTTAKAFKPLPSITSLDPPDGVIGTTVHIHGANFVNVGLVKFGTRDGTNVSAVSATEVDADVPAGFTGGDVSVQTLGGTVVYTTPFTLTKVTGFSPLAAKAGATVTITGQGLADTSSVDFVGHPDVTQLTKTATSVKVAVPPDALPGELELHTPNIDVPVGGSLKVVPTITSVSPADGQQGTTVTIDGTGFFTDAHTVVKFGTISLNAYTVMSANEITAQIPANFTSGPVSITTPGGGTAVSKTVVTVTTVTGISPSKATEGSTVTITGTGLASTNVVDFTGFLGAPVPGTIVSATATAVKVTVPTSIITPLGVGPVTIHTPNLVGLGGIASTQSFGPLPAIVPLAPTKAAGPLSITGSGFEPMGAATPPTVKLGTTILPVLFAFDTGAFTTLPANAITGTITVTTPEGSATAKLLVPPTISGGPTPSSGATGTQVQLTGLTFTGTTSVKVNGVATPFTLTGALGSTQTLTFKIPPTATSGAISVTNAGGTTSSTDFDVTPAIKAFTPISAPDGSTLLLTGTGFGGADLVTFGGGVTAVPSNVTPTALKVVVPQGAAAGPLTVHTATGGTSAASTPHFTPTATLSSFTPTSGPAGTSVTITGAGFTNVTDVLFDGTSVGPERFRVVGATEIDAAVPAGAADGVITVVRSKGGNLTSAGSFSVSP